MNKVFDIKRFCNLVKRNLYTSRMQFLQITGLLVAIYLVYILLGPILDFMVLSKMFMGLILVAAMFVVVFSPAFEEKRDKGKAIFNFILPASTFEKYAYLILKHVILIPVLCLIILNIFKYISAAVIPDDYINMMFNVLSWDELKNFYQIIAAQSIVLLVYLYARKYTLIKAVFVLIGLMIAINCLYMGVLTIATDGEGLAGLKSVYRTSQSYLFFDILKVIVVPVGMWVTGYFKLRETEI